MNLQYVRMLLETNSVGVSLAHSDVCGNIISVGFNSKLLDGLFSAYFDFNISTMTCVCWINEVLTEPAHEIHQLDRLCSTYNDDLFSSTYLHVVGERYFFRAVEAYNLCSYHIYNAILKHLKAKVSHETIDS